MVVEYDYRMNGVNQPSHKAHFRKPWPLIEIIHTDEALDLKFRTLIGTSEDHKPNSANIFPMFFHN